MPEDTEVLITEFRADIRRYEAALRRQVGATERATRNSERKWREMNRRIVRNQEQTERRLRRLISGAALTLAGRELLTYERSWRNVTNELRQYEDILGPATRSTRRLNGVANEAGISIGRLTPLVGAAARAARDLGNRGADDVIAFGEAFSKAATLANTGQSAVEGAATQLSQAIASPRVQLQEFQSVIEGTPRLAQAFADGIDEAGGSIARLRQLIATGEITGGALFTALLSQLPKIRREFETLNQGPEQALARLRNRLAEFVGTNHLAVDAARNLAGAIDFLSENIDAFADVVVVAGASLVGYFGARAAARIIAAITAETGAFARLAQQITLVNYFSGRAAAGLFTLRAATAFLGGPLVLGATVFAGGMALLATRTKSASEAMSDLQGTLSRYQATLRDIAGDQQRLTGLKTLLDTNEDITEAIKAQGFESEEAARRELGAITQRLAKNKQLLQSYKTLLRTQLTALETAQRDAVQSSRPVRRESDARVLEAIRQGRAPRQPDNSFAGDISNAEALEIVGRRIDDLNRKREEGVELTRAEGRELEKLVEIQARQFEIEAKRAALRSGDIDPDAPPPPSPTGGTGGLGDDELQASAALVRELTSAYNNLFDTELQGIERVRRERLAAIAESKLTETEKAREAVRVNAIADEQIAQLKREQAAEEIDLVNNVIDARDRAAGRSIAIALREFEARAAIIEREIENEVRRNEALRALAEEREAFLREARAALPGGAADEDSLQGEIERVRLREQEKLAVLYEAFDAELIALEEFEARKRAIIDESENEIADIRAAGLQLQLSAASDIFGRLTEVARQHAGEQSGVYRALFAIQKAFAAASAIVATSRGVAEALGRYPPDYVNAAIIAASGAAEIATIVATSFAKGGLAGRDGERKNTGGMIRGPGSGTSDSIPARLSNGEFVVNASATRRHLAILEAINAGRVPTFNAGGLVTRGLAPIAAPSVPSPVVNASPVVNVAAPQVNASTRVVNVSSMREAFEEFANGPANEKVVLNIIGKNRGKLSSQLGGGRNT